MAGMSWESTDVIYQELCLGIAGQESKREYLRIVADLAASGAQAVILGCTEIGVLISQGDTDTPLADTASMHARKAVEELLS